ncbi:hypothetical protein Ancab_011486 [Ancistrocladus abbreviatus]
MADTDIGDNTRLVGQEADVAVGKELGLELISQSNRNLEKGSETPKSLARKDHKCHQEESGTNISCGFINEQETQESNGKLGEKINYDACHSSGDESRRLEVCISSNSVTDSIIACINKINSTSQGGIRDDGKENAENIWAALLQLGVVTEIEDTELVGKIQEMECRDTNLLKLKNQVARKEEHRNGKC